MRRIRRRKRTKIIEEKWKNVNEMEDEKNKDKDENTSRRRKMGEYEGDEG
jgi:hypothetical protein